MRLIIVTLSLVFAPTVLGYARYCKRNTEPCIALQCSSTSHARYYPFSLLYGCCNRRVYDRKNFVCVLQGGKISLRRCDPCSEFRCGNGQCTLRAWRCDNIKNCLDGSDEVNCSPCGANSFKCHNGRCINKNWVCDKYNDCGDGSDESGCGTTSGGSCGAHSYRCKNDRCIPLKVVCDSRKKNHCGDMSDEKGCRRYKRNEIFHADEKLDDDGGKVKDADENTVP